MQNNLEDARKNVIAIIKKIASKLFVVILLASVLIGILTVIPEQVRAATGDVVKSFSAPTDTQPKGLAWDGSNLWMSSYMMEGGIYKLGPVDGSILGKYTPPVAQHNGYGGLTYDGTYLWEADSYGGGIYKLDPSDCSVIASIPSPDRSPLSDLAWDGDHLWLCGYPTQKIYKISPIDGSIVAEFKVPEGTGQAQTAGLTYAGEYLWLSGTSDILKLDPSDCEVISSFPAPCSRPDGLAWDGEYLWCASFDEAMIYQIDSGFVAEPTVPTSPQNLQATPGDGYVVLSWDAPSSDGGSAIIVYKIYRGTSYGKEVLLDSVTASRTSYKDTAVKNGQTYYYKVSAVNKEKEEGTFASTKATPTSSVTKPSAPQKLQSEASDRSVYLKWIAPDDDGGSKITNYNIYRGSTSGSETLLTTVGNVLTYTDNDVTNDRTYYYQVSAENSIGKGAISDEASATPRSAITTSALTHIVTTPSAPLNFIATAGDRVVNLNWNAPVDDGGSAITEYTIYRGTSSDAESYLDSVSAPTISYTDRAVTNDLIYYYKVSAENSVGEGDESNEVDVRPELSITQTTAPLVTTPSAPLNFRVTPADDYVNLEWTEPSDDGGSLITNYNIYRGTTSGEKTLLETVSNVLIYTDDNVIDNLRYYYQVSAVNSAGEGDMSDEKYATLIPGETVPSAPQDLNADRGDEYVDLSWNPPSNDGGSPITKYTVYRGTAPQGESFLAEVGNVRIYTDSHVTNDRQYYYQVSAENSAGEGEMSNEVGVEPRGDTLGMGVWITIIVSLIGALGVIAAALINYLSSKKRK